MKKCIFPAPLPLAEKGPSSIFSLTKRVNYSSLIGHSSEDQIQLFITRLGKKYQERYMNMSPSVRTGRASFTVRIVQWDMRARYIPRRLYSYTYICMHKCCIYLSILTHLFPSTYIYIYQFLPWLVCPIFFPSHDTSKLERDFLLVLNNCIHCTLYISCYTYAFESLLVESQSIDIIDMYF